MDPTKHISSVNTETFKVEPNTSFISTHNHGAHHDSHKNTGPTERWRVFIRNIGASFILNSFKVYSNRRDEPPKIVRNRSFTIALIRCSIHLLPIAVTVVLAYLNLAGYFIGDQLAGGAPARARDMLLLQIAAKIMVGLPINRWGCRMWILLANNLSG